MAGFIADVAGQVPDQFRRLTVELFHQVGQIFATALLAEPIAVEGDQVNFPLLYHLVQNGTGIPGSKLTGVGDGHRVTPRESNGCVL
jgi:hypothetical protein